MTVYRILENIGSAYYISAFSMYDRMDNTNRRVAERIAFSQGTEVRLMAIDGTWRRDCVMEDVSETGARQKMTNSISGLNLKEFFLVLSETGVAFRRCELAWVDGDHIGAHFLVKRGARKRPAAD
jgi:hypothetical protein